MPAYSFKAVALLATLAVTTIALPHQPVRDEVSEPESMYPEDTSYYFDAEVEPEYPEYPEADSEYSEPPEPAYPEPEPAYPEHEPELPKPEHSAPSFNVSRPGPDAAEAAKHPRRSEYINTISTAGTKYSTVVKPTGYVAKNKTIAAPTGAYVSHPTAYSTGHAQAEPTYVVKNETKYTPSPATYGAVKPTYEPKNNESYYSVHPSKDATSYHAKNAATYHAKNETKPAEMHYVPKKLHGTAPAYVTPLNSTTGPVSYPKATAAYSSKDIAYKPVHTSAKLAYSAVAPATHSSVEPKYTSTSSMPNLVYGHPTKVEIHFPTSTLAYHGKESSAWSSDADAWPTGTAAWPSASESWSSLWSSVLSSASWSSSSTAEPTTTVLGFPSLSAKSSWSATIPSSSSVEFSTQERVKPTTSINLHKRDSYGYAAPTAAAPPSYVEPTSKPTAHTPPAPVDFFSEPGYKLPPQVKYATPASSSSVGPVAYKASVHYSSPVVAKPTAIYPTAVSHTSKVYEIKYTKPTPSPKYETPTAAAPSAVAPVASGYAAPSAAAATPSSGYFAHSVVVARPWAAYASPSHAAPAPEYVAPSYTPPTPKHEEPKGYN